MNEASTRGQFARYVIAGAVNTAVTYVLLVALMRVIEYRLAYSIAYLAGVVLGCWLQCRFVFHVPLDWRNAIRFPAVYAIQYLTGLLLLWALVDAAGMRREWAALLVVVLNVPIGFFMLRFLLRVRARSSARDGTTDR
jgi:putative flippase GtrA